MMKQLVKSRIETGPRLSGSAEMSHYFPIQESAKSCCTIFNFFNPNKLIHVPHKKSIKKCVVSIKKFCVEAF